MTTSPDRSDEPTAARPRMPGYGLPDPSSREGLLPWSWARERLTAAHGYWIATTRPDGRPHLMVIWGVWHDDRFYFSTGARSRKARNLDHNPWVSVSTDDAVEAVIVEGTATHATDAAERATVRALYSDKYGEPPPDEPGSPLWVVHPRTAFGFVETAEFMQTATRWTFADEDGDV